MADYEFYRNIFLGDAVPEQAFPGAVRQASDVLDRFRRVYQVETPGPDSENMALCAMAESIYRAGKHTEGVAAASAGNVTVRYADKREPLMTRLYRDASVYLGIYRGVKG